MTSTTVPPLRVLFFDTFGTCVAQRKPVADELWRAAQQALQSDSSAMSSEVRSKAVEMSHEQWDEFGAEWNREAEKFVAEGKRRGVVDWKAVDEHRIEMLPRLLAHRGLVIPGGAASSPSELHVGEGSLWDSSQLQHLARIWHRLPPWPDTVPGLALLNRRFSTVALSNTYEALLKELVQQSGIPFSHLYSADMFHSFKPDPKVYLGAAQRMSVKPEECALVAAHLGDLRGAKKCGFFAIYVERQLEEKAPELRGEGIPDLVVGEEEGGFLTLAERLGV